MQMSTPLAKELMATAMDARMAELEADIARSPDPRIVELDDLKRQRSRYPQAEPAPPASPQATMFGVNGAHRKTGRKMSPEREQALKASRELLTGRTKPTLTSDVLKHIEGKGIKLKGDDRQSNLSALLYKTPGFVSHQRAGWTYEPEAPQ
jgi:hypothetical protein